MHLRRLLIALVAVALSLTGAPASAWTDLWSPVGLTVEARGLDLVISWQAATGGEAPEGYSVIITTRGRSEETWMRLPPDQTSTTVSGLPVWLQHDVVVVAVKGRESSRPAVAEPVRIRATLTMSDTSPIVVHGDDKGERYHDSVVESRWVTRELVLDAPMPVDVVLQPTVVSTSGVGLTADDPSDPGWPLLASLDAPSRIPAGQTRAVIRFYWGDDEWRRFTWAQKTFSVETVGDLSTRYPNQFGDVVISPDAQQSVTLFEEDTDPLPTAWMTPRLRARAGSVARVPIRLDHRVHRSTVVDVRTQDVTSRHGRDYRAFSGPMRVRKGSRVAWVRIPISRRARLTRFEVRLVAARDDGVLIGRRDRTVVQIRTR